MKTIQTIKPFKPDQVKILDRPNVKEMIDEAKKQISLFRRSSSSMSSLEYLEGQKQAEYNKLFISACKKVGVQ